MLIALSFRRCFLLILVVQVLILRHFSHFISEILPHPLEFLAFCGLDDFHHCQRSIATTNQEVTCLHQRDCWNSLAIKLLVRTVALKEACLDVDLQEKSRDVWWLLRNFCLFPPPPSWPSSLLPLFVWWVNKLITWLRRSCPDYEQLPRSRLRQLGLVLNWS